MPKQASDITNGIDVVKPPPGLRSVASATAAPLLDQHPRRREAPELQEERRRRQQRRDHAAAPRASARATRRRRSGDPPIARRLRRRRATPPLERELVGVDARLQAVALPGLENVARFVGREDAVLAEHVAPLGELLVARPPESSRR